MKLARSSLVVVLCSCLLVSCSRDTGGQGKGKGGPAVPVVVAKAVARNVPVEVDAIGNVEAYSTVSIRSQITGPILRVHFREGQDVKAGDLLVTIDPRSSEAALSQAKANLKRDEAQLVGARLEFERTKRLFESKIASRDDYDKAEAAFHSLEATVLADTAAIANAQVSLEFTAIQSPIDGRTGNLNVKEGNVVKETDDVLVTINQLRPIYVLFSVPEQYLPVIRRRMNETTLSVAVKVPGEIEMPRGELTFVNNTVDVDTGTIQLKAIFPNHGNALWPGQFVQAVLTLSNLVGAITVPSQAVQNSQSGEFVFVVKPDATVERRPVATGVTYESLTVITSGVNPDETVVIDGQLRLAPGSKVNIQPPLGSGSFSPAASRQ